MGHRPFKNPFFLTLNATGNFQARSAWEALEYLDVHWPAERTAHYRRARFLCQEAIDGGIGAEIARGAVEDAARRANILEQGWRPNSDGSRSVFRTIRQDQPQYAL
ncbi:hypothetical protein WH87_04630 [Devosia epidermidihirudinis]|uniref:DUF982 domain-containing protein n=1 Tax=Devosia epidermidihirudinis TaxID=1293439 RepID=A0A0F5QHI7_9HYPH|nr:hypothetical protein WH87_04630 [Devosia epidermidihirudinis]